MMTSWMGLAVHIGILVYGAVMCLTTGRHSKSAVALSFGFGLQAAIWSLLMYMTFAPDPSETGDVRIRMYLHVPWGWLLAVAQGVLTVGLIGLIYELRMTSATRIVMKRSS